MKKENKRSIQEEENIFLKMRARKFIKNYFILSQTENSQNC